MRYLVQARIFSFPASFWITDESGSEVFLVDGQAFRLRQTFDLKDASGNVRTTIRKQMFTFGGTMDIESGGAVIATVRRVPFSLFKHRYDISLADGSVLTATGDFGAHDWALNGDDRQVGLISKQWFRVRDTYGVEVSPGEDDALVISIAICIDRLQQDAKRRR
jgi:uncharacterized protein YxjI